ncbi:MAG: Flp family type IVb pilin [Chloroflexi bacterium]|nr:Flp family type IVb pilin [Chloroflexota bacterium]
MSQVYLKLAATLRQLTRREEGASLAEYGLLVALIAVVCIAAVQLLGEQINAAFETITSTL